MSSNLAFIRSIPPCAQMSHSLSVAKTRWSSKEGCTLNTWTYPSRHPSYKSRLRGDFQGLGRSLKSCLCRSGIFRSMTQRAMRCPQRTRRRGSNERRAETNSRGGFKGWALPDLGGPVVLSRHGTVLCQPISRMVAAPGGLEPWAPECVVEHLGVRVGRILPHEPVPLQGEAPNLLILEPREPLEVRRQRGADIGWGQLAAPGIVKHHEAGPILAGVHGLNPAVHLGVSFGHILMLTHPDGLPGTQNIQNLVDIRASEHVTVHED